MRQEAGKTTRLAVLAHDSSRDGETEIHELTLGVPADLEWLRGHFDGDPILAAVVQLWEAQLHLRAIWPDLITPRRVTKSKFRRPIRPEDRLLLRLRRTGAASQASFEFRRDGELCSSGVMTFRPPGGDAA